MKRYLSEWDALEASNDALREKLRKVLQWAEAYPLEVFPEPDFKRVHEVLSAAGIRLDAVSASNMRHVITQTKAIIGDI